MSTKTKALLISPIVVAAVAVASYFFFRGSSSLTYLNTIPKETSALARVNVKAILDKVDLSSVEMTELMRELTHRSEGSIGLDFDQPVYAFIAPSGNIGLAAAVADEAELTACCEAYRADGKASEVIQQRGFSWTVVENQWLLAFDKERALVMGPAVGAAQDQLRNEMAQLLQQDKDDSGAEGLFFASLANAKEAVAAIAAPEALPADARKFLSQFHVTSKDDATVLFVLDAQDEQLSLEAMVQTENDDVKAELEQIGQTLRPLKGDLIQHAHASNAAWVTANMEGSKVLELLRKNADIRLALLAINLVIDVDYIISSIDGDIATEMTDFDIRKSKDLHNLQFTSLTAQLATTDFVRRASSWGNRMMPVRQLSESDFMFGSNSEPVYFGVADQTFYLGSQPGICKEGNGYLRLQRDAIQGSRLFATFDIPKLVELSQNQYNLPLAIRKCERLDICMKEVGQLTFTLKAPKNTNILRALLKL